VPEATLVLTSRHARAQPPPCSRAFFLGGNQTEPGTGEGNMPTLDEVFESKYLKAADFKKGPRVLTIIESQMQTLKALDGRQQKKCVLYFENESKALVLNRTNFERVRDITGEEDSDDFPGHKIVGFADKTQMGGKTVDCVRVRAVQNKKKPDADEDAGPSGGPRGDR
jgi:hypothetical protein